MGYLKEIRGKGGTATNISRNSEKGLEQHMLFLLVLAENS